MKHILSIMASALLTIGCTVQNNFDINGKWTISKAMDVSTKNADTQPFITFSKNGQMNGNASVNVFSGNYTLEDDKLTLTNIAITQMMGPNMEIEDAITHALNSTSSIKGMKNEAYIFNSQKDIVMVLSRYNEEPTCGGYSDYRTLSAEDKELFSSTYDGKVALTPIMVSTQIVAGVNYSFICEDSKKNTYEVNIFQPLPNEGEPSVSSCVKRN